ncbi:MAG: hypothetical protein CL916_05985 [Deltaproteobacteria bacterium]|nr:hypothetical protein [Deltaproteobacteria bacterium]
MLIGLTKLIMSILMSLRSKQYRKERMNRLHQTARRHIAKHGVQGLQLKELAKELGYTAPALYRYYPSKEALIVDLQKETLHIMRHSLHDFLTHFASSSSLVKLILCAKFYIGYAQNSPASFALNNSVFSSTSVLLGGENRDAIIHAMRDVLLLIQEQIDQINITESANTFTHTMCFWSSLHGVLLTQKYKDDFYIPSPEHFVDTLLIGWGIPKSKIIEAQQQIKHHCDDATLVSFTSLDTKENP